MAQAPQQAPQENSQMDLGPDHQEGKKRGSDEFVNTGMLNWLKVRAEWTKNSQPRPPSTSPRENEAADLAEVLGDAFSCVRCEHPCFADCHVPEYRKAVSTKSASC